MIGGAEVPLYHTHVLLTAFLLGSLHALEADHMVAVSAFVSQRPSPWPAAGFGLRWGLGHSLAVGAAGLILVATGVRVPAGLQAYAERAVGVTLVLLGLWAVRQARRLHVHTPSSHGSHGHLHAHPASTGGAIGAAVDPDAGSAATRHGHSHASSREAGHHRHATTLVGAVHGLAGTVPIVALVPVTLQASAAAAVAYLLLFGLGTMLSMAAFASVAAVAMGRMAARLGGFRRTAQGMGWLCAALGVFWLWSAR